MIRNPDNAISHPETDLPHRFAVEALFPSAGRENSFVCVMHMDDPTVDRQARGGEQIYSAYNVMVAVQNVVSPTPQLRAQGTDERHLPPDGNGRMNHMCAQCSCLVVHRS